MNTVDKNILNNDNYPKYKQDERYQYQGYMQDRKKKPCNSFIDFIKENWLILLLILLIICVFVTSCNIFGSDKRTISLGDDVFGMTETSGENYDYTYNFAR